jgi:hypothetical protein
MRRTLSLTLVCSLALVPACGGGGEDTSPRERSGLPRHPLQKPAESGTLQDRACDLFRPGRVARIAGRPGSTPRARSNDSTDLSICDWRAAGLRVQLVVDAAPRAELRYFNQLAEQLQFYNADPERRPRQLRGVGDDGAYGGAGAWWTRAKGQLVAYARGRIVRVRVVGAGFDEHAKRRASALLARLALRRLSAPAPSGARAPR